MTPTTAPGGASRSARRLALTRQRLVSSARTLIGEKGVDGLRLREITEHADIGFGSFYTHFEDKEALVEAVAAEAFDELTRSIVGNAQRLPDPREAVSASHRGFVRLAHEDQYLARLLLHLDHAESLFESAVSPHARSTLERGIAEGVFTVPDLDVILVHAVGSTLAVMRGVLEGRLPADADVPSARALLCALGVDSATAAEIAQRPLPTGAPDR